MTPDDPANDGADGEERDDGRSLVDDDDLDRTRERLEEGAERAVDEFDQGIVDLLAWLLDTETRARIYVHLRQNPGATSQEIADGTGLYPSTVREALSELHEEETVTREKRESEGAGNNPYAYRAIPPSELVSNAIGEIQSELNAVFTLDDRLRGRSKRETEPVTISVEDAIEEDAGATEIDIDDVDADSGAGSSTDSSVGPNADSDDEDDGIDNRGNEDTDVDDSGDPASN